MRKIDPVLQARLAMTVSGMGYRLYGFETVPQGREIIFRIYIDSPTGVTVDDCSKVSHQIGMMLDAEALMQDSYTLEVSSPGVNRALFDKDHYRQAMGSQVKIRMHTTIDQQRQFHGKLQQVEDEHILLLLENNKEVRLPFADIEKANIVGEIRFSKHEPRKRKMNMDD